MEAQIASRKKELKTTDNGLLDMVATRQWHALKTDRFKDSALAERFLFPNVLKCKGNKWSRYID